MSNEQKKIYAGNGKMRETKIGTVYSMSICLTDLPVEYIKEGRNGKKYINLDLIPKKDGKDQFDNTHSVVVNTWKPDEAQSQPQQSNTPAPSMAEKTFTNETPGDLPF